MKKININIIFVILIIIVVAILATFIILLQKNNQKLVDDTIVEISNVEFTLNDIKDRFLDTTFASSNKCDGKVYDAGILLVCNNKEYDFSFNDYELQITTDESGKDIFKYLVNIVEELFGYKEDEFIDTLDRYLNGEIYVQGLEYVKEQEDCKFMVDVTKKLEKYISKTVINSETIKNISDVDYEYENLGYKFTNIEVIKDDYINFLTFSAVIGGKDIYDANLTINYYDDNDNLITTTTVNLSDYDTFGNPYLGLVVNIELTDDLEFNKVNKYSFYLS